MPWVIKDFKSEFLDLEDQNSFRDLSLPIGAINKERLREFRERYDETPPEVAAILTTPATVDVTESEQGVEIHLDVVDDMGGVMWASAFFKGPGEGCHIHEDLEYTVQCIRQTFDPPATTGTLTARTTAA